MDKKVILITGGTTGIGLSTIHKFLNELNENIEIISISRSKRKIENAKLALKQFGKQVHFFQADVSDKSEIEKVQKEISTKFSKIDVLINNAGNIIPGGLEDLSFENWNSCISNNLSSFFYVTKIFVDMLKCSKYPSIVNISSISSKLAGASMGYSVAKAGVDMVTMCLARELSKYKIRVNGVNPGITKSGFQVNNNLMDEFQYESFLDNISKDYPIGIGECKDVSELIFFLTTEKAKWITGSMYIIDGGRSVNI
ncbi:MAG: SDR family oxidoreductase [Prevotellaceae bacterium]|jgi:NAD(P)-dependent dehydrogenase (short-subunit alcohol dehydrogenase family)|nr:SDR family oxidoreductase [Prevotellaceae bacterium]